MIKEIIGDIFNSEVNVIIHQANCYHTMGGGIAKHIADNYPEAEDADNATQLGESKLGSFSYAFVDSGKKLIINMYSQGKFGRGKNFTSYDAMFQGLTEIKKFIDYELMNKVRENNYDFKDIVVGVPYLIGCGLAGGNWIIVENVIQKVFENFKYPFFIVKLPQYVGNSNDNEKIII